MYYVELLRVLKTLRILAYVLGVLIVLAIASRPFSHNSGFESGPAPAAGVTPVVVHNADGSTTKSYMDRKGRHIDMQLRPDGSFTITTTDPNVKPGKPHPRVTTISGDDRLPFNALLIISACLGALVASVLALTLSRENDGHLEIAWTKPFSRERYALATMLTDGAGVLASAAMMLVTILIVFAIYGGLRFIVTDSQTFASLVFSVVFPLSIYGIVVAATASLRKGAVFLGMFWPVALILPSLSGLQWLNLGQIVRIVDIVNPVAYLYAFNGAGAIVSPVPPQAAYQIGALAILTIAGVAASLAQWRRLEA